MARFVYNPTTAMGQILSEGIDQIQEGKAKLARAAGSLREMTAAEAAAEFGLTEADYIVFRNQLTMLVDNLRNEETQTSPGKLLVRFDYG